MRKERRVRPGFTPQEDVQRFRGTRQQAADARSGTLAAGKGGVPGWTVPGAAPVPASSASLSKAAKKNEKRKKKRQEKRDVGEEDEGEAKASEPVAENWDSDDDAEKGATKVGEEGGSAQSGGAFADKRADTSANDIADKLEKLAVS